jgi:asparagine N-glycosylation enzyme membrane subunit Stt3
MERRAYLTLGGAAVVATVAGCLGGDSDSGGDGATGDGNESTNDGNSGDDSDSDTDNGSADDSRDQSAPVGWRDSLDWLSRNTPESGQHATTDGDYGVLSWWEYSDRIANSGDRVPAASSAGQHTEAAELLLAQDESEALDISTGFGDGTEIQYVMVDAAMTEVEESLGGLYPAMVDADPEFDRGEFYLGLSDESSRVGTVHRQPYYESLLVRLYHYHGSSAEHGRFLTRWEGEPEQTESGDMVVQTPEGGVVGVVRFTDDSEKPEEARSDPARQVGGIGAVPAADVPALERFRLVYDDRVPAVPGAGGNDRALDERDEGEGDAIGRLLDGFGRESSLLEFAENRPLEDRQEPQERLFETTPTFTKTFERVPGAVIQGSLPESAIDHDQVEFAPGDSVGVSVPLDPPNGREFIYEQTGALDENLAFELRVPYATTGYDEYGPAEGYTDVGVRAVDPYTVETARTFDTEKSEFVWFGADVDIAEGQVVGAEDPTVTVELEERAQEFDFGSGDDGGAGNSTDG